MGVGVATAEFLVEARQRGVRFDRTATIGRQWLLMGPVRVARMLNRHGQWPAGMSRRDFLAGFRADPGFVEPLLRVLGAEDPVAIDASPYEGAALVRDLNEPVGEDLRERFSLVVDGGSLEHIFNVPVALRNYMEMVEVGGHLVIQTMANNAFGHGFFQFSPELFYRALSPENGFTVERVVVCENELSWREPLGLKVAAEHMGPWYEVRDPATVRERVELQTRRGTIVQVLARRTAAVPIFASTPQQSDYAATWADHAEQPGPTRAQLAASSVRERLSAVVPLEARMTIALDVLPKVVRALDPLQFRTDARRRSFANGRWYRRVR
jgi:hypothetical protein